MKTMEVSFLGQGFLGSIKGTAVAAAAAAAATTTTREEQPDRSLCLGSGVSQDTIGPDSSWSSSPDTPV